VPSTKTAKKKMIKILICDQKFDVGLSFNFLIKENVKIKSSL